VLARPVQQRLQFHLPLVERNNDRNVQSSKTDAVKPQVAIIKKNSRMYNLSFPFPAVAPGITVASYKSGKEDF
jgi:hypothetical protein